MIWLNGGCYGSSLETLFFFVVFCIVCCSGGKPVILSNSRLFGSGCDRISGLNFVGSIENLYFEVTLKVFCHTCNLEHQRTFWIVLKTAPRLNWWLTKFNYFWLIRLVILWVTHVLFWSRLRPRLVVLKTSTRMNNTR